MQLCALHIVPHTTYLYAIDLYCSYPHSSNVRAIRFIFLRSVVTEGSPNSGEEDAGDQQIPLRCVLERNNTCKMLEPMFEGEF